MLTILKKCYVFITRKDGSTSLLLAAYSGNYELVTALIDRNADKNIGNKVRTTNILLVIISYNSNIYRMDGRLCMFHADSDTSQSSRSSSRMELQLIPRQPCVYIRFCVVLITPSKLVHIPVHHPNFRIIFC